MRLMLRMSRLFVAVTLVAGPSAPVYSQPPAAPAPAAAPRHAPEQAKSSAFKMPLYFEANAGQTDASVKFLSHGAGYNLFLAAAQAVLVLRRPKADTRRGPEVVRMKIQGADAMAAAQGRDTLPGRTSYFYGNDPAAWRVGVKHYAQAVFHRVYPGIDMVYYAKQGTIEHDFIVAPGADPGRILIAFEGGHGMRLDRQGNLLLRLDDGELTYNAPTLYQRLNGKRTHVNGRFVLAGNNQVRIAVGDYIKKEALVIDPQLSYSTYLGGAGADEITSIAVDGTQEAYVAGWSRSAPSGAGGFPAAAATYPTVIGPNNGGADVFVAKLSADGSTLLWLAWLGGAADDEANAIALDKSSVSSPNVYIAGVTASSTTFPTKGNPTVAQACSPNTGTLAFAAELTQTGNVPSLTYSTCWGGVSGALTNSGNGIAVDSLGAAYVTGTTFAQNFPITLGVPAPYNTSAATSQDAFVFKLAPAGAYMEYSMLIGAPDGINTGNAIAVDAAFDAWVTGETTSSAFPGVTGHFSSTEHCDDSFVAEVNPTGTGLNYATYINGDTAEIGTAIAIDSAGMSPYNVFVAGWTSSAENFPSAAYYALPTSVRPVVYQKNLQGSDDPFILRLNPFATNPDPGSDNPLEMVCATHLGATGADRAYALALDDRDDAYIAGWTVSTDWTASNDPLTPGPRGYNVTGNTTSNTSGGQDAFVAAMGPTCQTVPFFAYLGASPSGQAATGIAVDALHNIYVAGFTPSAIFPLTTGSLQTSVNGNGTAGAFDGFVTKIGPVQALGAPLPAACTIIDVEPSAGYNVGGTTVTITGTNFDVAGETNAVQFNGERAESYTVNAASNVITAVSPRYPLSGPLAQGAAPLTVTTPAGTCDPDFVYYASGTTSCEISNVTPDNGYTDGGTTVQIVGINFNGLSGPYAVTFDSEPASSYTVNATSTGITAVSPRHPLTGPLTSGSVPLKVTASSSTCSTVYDYVTPPPGVCTISSLNPASGFSIGGTTVTVLGTGFYGFSGPNGVSYDGESATSYAANNAGTVLTTVTPQHPLSGPLTTGMVPFLVTTTAGTCSANYNYLLSPESVGGGCGEDYFFPSPDSGPVGNFAYCMAASGTVEIRVYNVVGEIVAKITDTKPAGSQLSPLNTARLAPGVYLYLLEKNYGNGNSVHESVKKFVVRH